MKKSLFVLCAALAAASCLAAEVPHPGPLPGGEGEAAPVDRARVIQGIVALVVPALIGMVKGWLPINVRPFLPYVAPLLGELLALVATSLPRGSGALAGLAGVGVREAAKQFKLEIQNLKVWAAPLVTLGLAGTLALPMTGCASVGGTGDGGPGSPGGVVMQRLPGIAYVAAYVGTTETLRAHPEYRPGFELASDELKVLESGPVDVLQLMEIVRRLPVKELRSDRAQLIVTAGTMLLADQIGTTPIEQIQNLQPVIAAIRRGIDRGLGREE